MADLRRCWLRRSLLAGALILSTTGRSLGGDEARAIEVVRRPIDSNSSLVLMRNSDGTGTVLRVTGDQQRELQCGPFAGAWGLWLTDVDGDGSSDLVVTLKKKARFDPVVENRLHVYALVKDRCVPMWRGTRLAGRFEKVDVAGGRLLVLERIGEGRRRIARYRWTGFGYAVDRVQWRGAGDPPAELVRDLVGPDSTKGRNK